MGRKSGASARAGIRRIGIVWDSAGNRSCPVSASAAQSPVPLPPPVLHADARPPYPWAVLPLSLVFFLFVGSRGQQSVGIDHRGCESLAASGRRALLMAHYQEDAPERQGHRS